MSKEIVKGSSTELPVKPEELRKYILFTTGKLNAQKALLNTIKKVGVGKAVYDQKLKEAQDMAGMVLIAEARLGELLKAIPRKGAKSDFGSAKGTKIGHRGLEKSLPEGITKRQSYEAQKLAKNKDVIEEVIDSSVKAHDIPTRSKVLRKIDSKKKAKTKTIKLEQGIIDEKPDINDVFESCTKEISIINIGLPEMMENWGCVDESLRDEFALVSVMFFNIIKENIDVPIDGVKLLKE